MNMPVFPRFECLLVECGLQDSGMRSGMRLLEVVLIRAFVVMNGMRNWTTNSQTSRYWVLSPIDINRLWQLPLLSPIIQRIVVKNNSQTHWCGKQHTHTHNSTSFFSQAGGVTVLSRLSPAPPPSGCGTARPAVLPQVMMETAWGSQICDANLNPGTHGSDGQWWLMMISG